MKLSQIILIEKTLDIVSSLNKYRTRDDVYISYSDIPKLGINPQSDFKTPIGIYAYPLKEMWESVENNAVPYAGKREYVIVFQSVHPILDVDQYTKSMLDNDVDIIKKKYLGDYIKWYSRFNADHTWGNQNRYEGEVLDLFFNDDNLTDHFKRSIDGSWHSQKKWIDTIFFSEGHPSWKPLSDDDINEFTGASKKTINKIRAVVKEWDEGKLISEEKGIAYFNNDIANWSEDATYSTAAASVFFNITRNIASLMASHYNRKSQIVWTALLRSLGYEGFTDKTNIGIIHPNEPTQAVFFSIKPLRLIEILKSKKEPPKSEPREFYHNKAKQAYASDVDLLNYLDPDWKTKYKKKS